MMRVGTTVVPGRKIKAKQLLAGRIFGRRVVIDYGLAVALAV